MFYIFIGLIILYIVFGIYQIIYISIEINRIDKYW